jgi:cell wall-associated NlpC family hydrolase
VNPDDIIAAARSALGTPFRHQGREVGRGLDCAGLICHVCDTLGIAYSDQTRYARQPSGGLLESALDGHQCIERVQGSPMPGDLLLLRFAGEPQHLAIFTGTNMIHAHQPLGKVCEHGFTGPWPRRLVRVYRFVGVES